MTSQRDKTILHVDMDAFFASVEQHEHPDWRGKPVIVGAGPNERGVVSTCSYEARKFGVHSAMPSREAGRLCPHGIFTHGNYQLYSQVSAAVFKIFDRYTPFVEPVSIDEAFLDITGSLHLFGNAFTIAEKIRSDIKQELGITASVGIAHNLFLAKLASDMHKPDGVTEVPFDENLVRSFLAPLKVGNIWGVGKVTREILENHGIRTIGDIQNTDITVLKNYTEKSLAEQLKKLASGIDDRQLVLEWNEKSISREYTFDDDTEDKALIEKKLTELAFDVGRRVRKDGRFATIGKLKLRWDDFRTITRQSLFPTGTRDDFSLREKAIELFCAAYNGGKIRLIGFGVTGLSEDRVIQLSLFDEHDNKREKRERVCSAMDKLGEKIGPASIKLG